MSMNRENIVWQSPDGTWNRGFWAFEYNNEDDEDFDPEWDVNYFYDRFGQFRGGFATKEQAANWTPGANPGHITYASDEDSIEDLERVKLRFTDPKKAEELDRADRQAVAVELIAEARVKAGDEVRVVVAGAYVYGGRLSTNDGGETVLVLPQRASTMPKRPDLVILGADGTPDGTSELTSISKQPTHDRFSRRW